MARWYITDHAVEQFCMRVDAGVSGGAARVMLEKGVLQSAKLKGNTFGGQSRYLLNDPKCIAIVKHEGGVHVVVTVLSVTGDQGRKWLLSNEPAAALPEWKPPNHPDWQDLRNEYRAELPMALLRASTRANVQGAVKAWMRMQ